MWKNMACASTPHNWKRYLPMHFICRAKFLLILTTVSFFCLLIVTVLRNSIYNDSSKTFYINSLQHLRADMELLEVRNQKRYENISSRITDMMKELMKEKETTRTNDLLAREKRILAESANRKGEGNSHDSSSLILGEKYQRQNKDHDHDQCKFRDHRLFPLCKDSLTKLKTMWNTSTCYTEYHNIDGSPCSLYKYLTQVEPYCIGEEEIYSRPDQPLTTPREDINGLLKLLPRQFYRWMRKRAAFLWSYWVKEAKKFSAMKNKRKKVVVFLGGLSYNDVLIRLADKGGPLGELVQWTDVITALYVLGYDLHVVRTVQELEPIVKEGLNSEHGCAKGRYTSMPDVIYGDINSVAIFDKTYGEKVLAKFRCTFRVLDSFGTFVEYNYPSYPHQILGGRSLWGNLNLIPTQFLTMFPHTQDNSYLGFVVSNATKIYNIHYPSNRTKHKALLYAKESRYLYFNKGTIRYLEIVSEYFDIHATCGLVQHLPSFITNHGAVSGQKIEQLLSEAKVFLGVGFPYEGPGPIEAMANGAVYLQPKFSTPINKMNEKFFAGKPTQRKLHSQNPYMEEFVGEPYCYTIDVSDENLLRKTLVKINSMPRLPSKIPKDFSYEGMLERIYIYTQRMDYCNPFAPRWPPIQEHLKVYLSAVGESCKDVCMSKGLVCERTYFDDINSVDMIETHNNGVKCTNVRSEILLHAPSFNVETGVCYLQLHQQVFSCMHSEQGFQRLCPCRDYEQGQSALCRNCL